MERLRNLNSGLGQYCLQLGRALAQEPAAQDMAFEAYLPEVMDGVFGPSFQYLHVNKWHKWTGVDTSVSHWHCMHQDSEYFPKNRNVKLSMTIHDLNFLERPDYSGLRKRLKTRSLQKQVNRCQGIVYVSEFVKQWAHRYLDISEGMVEAVIYNGVQRPDALKNEARPYEKPYLFSIGLHPKKNYAVALPILVAEPGLIWVIAGGDSKGYRAEMEKAADKIGVGDRLLFTGSVNDQMKWQLFRNCEALIFPSLSEGFGIPVLEAMICGKPVFLSRRTSLPEVGGGEAYYFDSFEAEEVKKVFSAGMEDFRKDPEKAERLKSHAKGFGWQASAKQYLAFFQHMHLIN